jgi:hypothetical protein
MQVESPKFAIFSVWFFKVHTHAVDDPKAVIDLKACLSITFGSILIFFILFPGLFSYLVSLAGENSSFLLLLFSH